MKLKIGNYTYDYSEVDKIHDDGRLGEHSYTDLSIKIKKDLKPIIKRITIAHEVLGHALLIAAGYSVGDRNDQENLADILANSFIKFIDDNPEFVKNKLIKKV